MLDRFFSPPFLFSPHPNQPGSDQARDPSGPDEGGRLPLPPPDQPAQHPVSARACRPQPRLHPRADVGRPGPGSRGVGGGGACGGGGAAADQPLAADSDGGHSALPSQSHVQHGGDAGEVTAEVGCRCLFVWLVVSACLYSWLSVLVCMVGGQHYGGDAVDIKIQGGCQCLLKQVFC